MSRIFRIVWIVTLALGVSVAAGTQQAPPPPPGAPPPPPPAPLEVELPDLPAISVPDLDLNSLVEDLKAIKPKLVGHDVERLLDDLKASQSVLAGENLNAQLIYHDTH